MDKKIDIFRCLQNNDLPLAESLINLLRHANNTKIIFQINYLNLIEKKTNDFFFKLYIFDRDNDEWEYFDHGWLKNNTFYAHKSKILIFEISNIKFKMKRREDSYNHANIINNGDTYLLYNPHSEVVDLLFLRK